MKNSQIETPIETEPITVIGTPNPKFRTKYPRRGDDHQGSNTYGVSKTIPNETYTIRELLNKHTSGIMPDVQRNPIYSENASHDDLDLQKANRLDIVEKQQLQTQQLDIITQLDEILTKSKLERDKKIEQQKLAKQPEPDPDKNEVNVKKGSAGSE